MLSLRLTRGVKFAFSSAGARILQVVDRAAVGQRRDQRGQLQRRHLNALAEAGHARHAAILRRLGGERTRDALPEGYSRPVRPGRAGARNAKPCQIPCAGRAPQRMRCSSAPALRSDSSSGAARPNHRVARDHAFLQRRHRNHRLDGRAGNEAGGKCQLLIDDAENAASSWDRWPPPNRCSGPAPPPQPAERPDRPRSATSPLAESASVGTAHGGRMHSSARARGARGCAFCRFQRQSQQAQQKSA